jgi:flagellar hook-associated protein 1 FlgK
MSIGNLNQIGNSGLVASRTALSTTGHNISNAATEGFSRQKVLTQATHIELSSQGGSGAGSGTIVSGTQRINDEYLEKQIRSSQKELSKYEEKEILFKQVEDIFNDMNDDGLSHSIGKFFNDFRKLSQEPESQAMRHAVRESSQAMVDHFQKIRNHLQDISRHTEERIAGSISEVNHLTKHIASLNDKIRALSLSGGNTNDFLDQRDVALKALSSLLETSVYQNESGAISVNLPGSGPLVSAYQAESLQLQRVSDPQKSEGTYAILSPNQSVITHSIKNGKLGALLEIRDQVVAGAMEHLDAMAFSLTEAVNRIHEQGFAADGRTGIAFFEPSVLAEGAVERFSLSQAVLSDVNAIATASIANAPGDNRVALKIADLQNEKLIHQSSLEGGYESFVSDLAMLTARNRASLTQEKDAMMQLHKMRDQISGVSIDEETTQLLQYQHIFDACARVIQVADDLMKTILNLKRD